MRELTVPEIEDPDRFFPDPLLVKSPVTRVLPDGYGEFYHPHLDRWERVHPICLEIIAGLEKGLAFDPLVETLSDYPEQNITPHAAGRIARKYLWKLHKLGYVHLDLEEPPAVFNGRYERVKELGRGGLGVAHLCRDLKADGREVVVKHPWGFKGNIDSGQRGVAMEIELMKTLDHPAVPRLHDSFTIRGLLHLVRDYVDGTKVSALAARGQLSDRAYRLSIARPIADVIAHIHDRGHLFFDPSADNFFVLSDGSVRVTDLGAVRPMEEGRKIPVKGGRGTPGYVAPELRVKVPGIERAATVQSDVYSFACLYYTMAVGRRPGRIWCHSDFVAALAEKQLDPRDRALIEACCQDDPALRPADMREVLRMLA